MIMNVNVEILKNSGVFTIVCSGKNMSGGKPHPSIYGSKIATEKLIEDGVEVIEGELLLKQQQFDESVLTEGELIVSPNDEDANYYSLSGLNLNYSNSPSSEDVIVITPGNSLILSLNPKISGKITEFNDWDLNSVGGSSEITCRILVDGLFWQDWQGIDSILNSDPINVENNITIQVKINNIGNSNMQFNDFSLYGLIELNSFVAPTFNSSIFANLFGTEEQNKLEVNLFKKLYFRGILPNYIIRGENRDYREDENYITFVKSIARYFSIILSFFKKWEDFDDNYDMLREQMKAYGVFIDENKISLQQLQFLARNILSNFQQRGTSDIFKRNVGIDGEFLRLTKNRICDELIYDYIPKWKMGWCMRQSSPIYRGTCDSYSLNKTGENGEGFESLSNFKINKSSSGATISIVNEDNKSCLRLSTTGSGKTASLGGFFDDPILDSDKIYTADTQLDYQISFDFKISNNARNCNILFGIEGYDINKNKLNDAFCNPNGTVINDKFFNTSVRKFKTGIWYTVRAIIHAYSTNNINEIKCNIGFGTELYFFNPFVKYFLPKIELVSSDSSTTYLYIYNYKIRPSVRGRNVLPLKSGEIDARSLGFIQFGRFFHTYFRNNNNINSVEELTNIIEKYLYPFDSINLFTITGNKD
jgi:hypothetical protein